MCVWPATIVQTAHAVQRLEKKTSQPALLANSAYNKVYAKNIMHYFIICLNQNPVTLWKTVHFQWLLHAVPIVLYHISYQ